MRQRHIEVFRALMLTHSATRAAEQLHTSQPTASRFLADLEREIGFKLFTRTGGKLFPTPEADALYVEVQRSFAGLDRISEVAAGIAEFRAGRLRIASISAFAHGALVEVVPRFREKFNSVEMALQIGSFDEVVRAVVANQCEIGFVAYPVGLSGMTQYPLVEVDSVCAMPAGHRLEAMESVSVEDLRGERFISLGHNVPSGRHVDQIFAAAGVERGVVLETQTAAVACAFIKQGMGVSILDPFTVGALLDERMSARPFVPGFRFHFSALMRSDRPAARIARRFLDEVRQTLTEAPPERNWWRTHPHIPTE